MKSKGCTITSKTKGIWVPWNHSQKVIGSLGDSVDTLNFLILLPKTAKKTLIKNHIQWHISLITWPPFLLNPYTFIYLLATTHPQYFACFLLYCFFLFSRVLFVFWWFSRVFLFFRKQNTATEPSSSPPHSLPRRLPRLLRSTPRHSSGFKKARPTPRSRNSSRADLGRAAVSWGPTKNPTGYDGWASGGGKVGWDWKTNLASRQRAYFQGRIDCLFLGG